MSTWGDWILNIFFINGFIGTRYVDGAHWYLTILISFIVIISIAKKINIEQTPLFYIIWITIRFLCNIFNIPYLPQLIGGSYIGFILIAVALKYFIENREQYNFKESILWGIVMALGAGSIFIYLGAEQLVELIIIVPLFLGCIYEKLPFMTNKLLVFVGSISYPLYLIHQNISFEIEYYLMCHFGYYNNIYGIIAIFVSVVIAVILSKITCKVSSKYLFLFKK